MRLHVRYGRPRDLVTDFDQQIARGGLLVRTNPPAGTEQFQFVELDIASPAGTVKLKGQVAQVFPGTGVAVLLEAPGAALARLVDEARAAGDAPGPEPVHGVGPAPASKPAARAGQTGATGEEAYERMKNASTPEKVQMALHGSRDERALVLRDINQSLHVHVLRNPGLQLDEVVAIAKMRNVSVELLNGIAERREWSSRAEVAIQLVRNPKTPVATAIRLLDHVSASDLRQLAKDTNARQPIQQAARKKVLS